LNVAYFDHFAGGTSARFGDWLTEQAIERECRFLSRYLPGDRSLKLLEIGPGHGEFAARLMSAGYRNYAVAEPDSILRVKLEQLGLRRAKSYLTPNLSESAESYDAIIIRDAFEHLNDSREAQQIISEARRVPRFPFHIESRSDGLERGLLQL
jgi:2-polyprenyl-3-methyl-5-hydroxy-6-metoxy-1,4-benzoquinol methylase